METAIEKGITYVSTNEVELPVTGPQFIVRYIEELEDGKRDIQNIYEEIIILSKGYEAVVVELKNKGDFQYIEERYTLIHDSLKDYERVTHDTCKVLDAYREMATMVKTMEDGGCSEAYIWSRKQELLTQNKGLNSIFDGIDFYIASVYEILNDEIAYGQSLLRGEEPHDAEEDQVKVLTVYQRSLSHCVTINKLLIERLQEVLPLIESMREDVMKLQVALVNEDVEERRRRLMALRQQEIIEDVTDYEDLEGQYRHAYDEEGNHVAIEEGGEGGNRRSLTALLLITALVVIMFAVYVYMK